MTRYINRLSHGTRDGLDVRYVKRRGVVVIGGWYDSIVGIEQWEIPLGKFLTELGITEQDVHKALQQWST